MAVWDTWTVPTAALVGHGDTPTASQGVSAPSPATVSSLAHQGPIPRCVEMCPGDVVTHLLPRSSSRSVTDTRSKVSSGRRVV